jgi:hypothetical protein
MRHSFLFLISIAGLASTAVADVGTQADLDAAIALDSNIMASGYWGLERPASAPVMSPYGWVGAWNWGLSAVGSSDGPSRIISADLYSPIPQYVHEDFREATYQSYALRLSAEKVLSPSFATRIELDYGSTHVEQRALYTDFDRSYNPAQLYYTSPLLTSSYEIRQWAFTWGNRVNSSGAWMPPGGWTWDWGPQGRAWHPSLDAKISFMPAMLIYPGSSYVGFSPRTVLAISSNLPIFNGFSVKAGTNTNVPLLSSSYTGSYDLNYARASIEADSRLAGVFVGADLAWPQLGPADPLKDANPDGRLYHPRLGLALHTLGSDIIEAWSGGMTVTLPLSPASSLELGAVQLKDAWSAIAVQRYSVAWQLYGDRPQAR